MAVPGRKEPELREIAYSDVAHAQVQVEFKPAPKAETALLGADGAGADGVISESSTSSETSADEENR